MGIPSFFRFISERYPCINEPVKEFQVPEFDYLYLDMNGLIHTCSHPEDINPYFFLTEEKIFANIFYSLEVLFNIIKPRKLFFIAVDGVAPRAKMNNQRGRRFKSAKEVELMEKKLLDQEGKLLPKERFDSNSISPGTVFMDQLDGQLKYFVHHKISTDPLWQRCKIILSGHQTPGEGEHKIMDYIRYLRAQPDYDANMKHCLYGKDADLIILGLSTHEPHFSLLREKVDYKKKQKKQVLPDEAEYQLLHLSTVREYLDLEFQELKEVLSFEYNLDKIIDDWVLMSFLVGNDFIPNLPNLHIKKGALPILYKTYKEVLPTLDGYINENGILNLPRFQKYLENLSKHDIEIFEETFADLAFLEEKMENDFFSEKRPDIEVSKNAELEELIKSTNDMFPKLDECFDLNEENSFLCEFYEYKKNYYANKLDCGEVTEKVIKSQAEGYVRAIQWNLHYYYRGCQSWSWYYPHHYSPYISDIINFKDLKLEFEMGEPLLPFEQLLAILPPASKNLVPEVYRELMVSPNSPLKEFYPEDFEIDLNGKQFEWEAIILIPFIEEERLLKAMKPYNDKLTPEEKRRNQHKPMSIYIYTEENLGVYRSPKYFPSVPANHALEQKVAAEELAVIESKLKFGLLPGVSLNAFFPVFPSLNYFSHTAALKKVQVKVFNFASSEESMVLTLKTRKSPPTEELARNLLGKIIYVNWPHLVESKVVAIADDKNRFSLTNENQLENETMDEVIKTQWVGTCQSVAKNYLNRFAIDIGPTDVLVYVSMLEGWKYSFVSTGKIINEKIWSSVVTPHPLQTVVRDVAVLDSLVEPSLKLQDAFPEGTVVFMLGQPHFGSMGKVLESPEFSRYGRLNVSMELVNDPVIGDHILKLRSKTSYFSCRIAALKVGINPRLLGRLTGSIFIYSINGDYPFETNHSKINIGLKLKSGKNLELPGYTKKKNDVWLYSMKAVDLVSEYVKKFSRTVEHLSLNLNKDRLIMKEIFPDSEGITEASEILDWIKSQKYSSIEMVECGAEVVDEEITLEIENIVRNFKNESFKRIMQVKPHLLYRSDLVFGNVPPVKTAKHFLLDRVVSIRSYSVPTGLRGFIIGKYKAADESENTYDVLFDRPFSCLSDESKTKARERKIFRMSRGSFLNISDANRCSQLKNSNKSMSKVLNRAPNANLHQTGAEEKASAFVQWNQPKEIRVNDDRFKQMWSDLESLKPLESTDVLKKILKIDESKKPQIEEPVKSFFEKVSKISKESPSKMEVNANANVNATIINQLNDQNSNKYYIQLFSYYQRKCLGQPRFDYLYIGGKVVAKVYFYDGRVYTGLPCDDKESACESACLQVLGSIGEVSLSSESLLQNEDLRIKLSQIKLSKALEKSLENSLKAKSIDQCIKNQLVPDIPHKLPHPPSRWVDTENGLGSQNKGSDRQKKEIRNSSQIIPVASDQKQSTSALEFVPLQAIIGKRNVGAFTKTQSCNFSSNSKRPTNQTGKKIEPVVSSTKHSASSHTIKRPNRKPKIAANLALDPNLF